MIIDFRRLGLQTTLNKVDINFLYHNRLLNEIWRDPFCFSPAGAPALKASNELRF